MARERPGWEMRSSSAARVTLPTAATVRNQRTVTVSMLTKHRLPKKVSLDASKPGAQGGGCAPNPPRDRRTASSRLGGPAPGPPGALRRRAVVVLVALLFFGVASGAVRGF